MIHLRVVSPSDVTDALVPAPHAEPAVMNLAVLRSGGGDGAVLAYPERTVVDGDAACVIWRYAGKNAQGENIAYPHDPDRPVIGATYFQVRDGKVTYIRTVHDSVPFVGRAHR